MNLISAAVLLMALLSLIGLLPGMGNIFDPATLVIGIAAYFLTEKAETAATGVDALRLRDVPKALGDRGTLCLLFAPMLMNALCQTLAPILVPAFFAHLTARASDLAFERLPLLIVQLAVSALGEEIAWRGFFLRRLTKRLPRLPALLAASVCFALCHFTPGAPAVVAYDLLFVFLNALLYGLIFIRTGNLYVSALAHFAANLFGIVSVVLL